MRRRTARKMFVYFLCMSFLSWMSGFSAVAAETRTLPIGEMVSKGEVKLDGSGTSQEKFASSYSPVFPGTKVLTDKGAATVRLSNSSQIGIYANSSFSFDDLDRYSLNQGTVEFYAPPSSEMKIKAGDVTIVKQRTQVTGKEGDTFGSISMTNGSVTVKSAQGKFSVLNPYNTVLADLGPKEAVTISKTSDGKMQVAAAAAGGTAAGGASATETGEFLGLSTWGWVGAAAAAAAVGVGIGVAAGGGGGGGASCD